MALLYVLWTISLLTIIASATLSSGTVSYRLARNMAEQAQQEALAQAAVNRAVLALMDRRPERRWRVDGMPQEFMFATTRITVTIQDELGRVDLNHADAPLVKSVFRAAGLSVQATDAVTDKVLDWREQGPLKRLHGAKAPEYSAAGLPHRPRNGPFQSMDELRLVLGVTEKIFARAEPMLTIYSGRPTIDPQHAPRSVLRALLGDQDGLPGTLRASPVNAPVGIIDSNIPLDGRAFSIQIGADLPKVSRKAVIRLTPGSSRSYQLLSWKPVSLR